MLTAPQLRAARALLDWKQQDLAKKAKIGLATVQRLEIGRGPLMAHVATVLKIEACLKAAGVVLIEQDDRAGAGVRWR
ncbi:MAG: helix-turn-helix transcriptional regulator [Bradyrhizobium sp.]|uniref:helix-turn-helix domain-containing protein n=1 Tax=Bradyrhizobium sp. TaxID=376 RepID=UPI001D8D7333|nr:helix-turn-helix transcriptional regulator [Bradyrhizobium sp.]MBV9566462.1 helix-turn-helix transcriptional regulator [Bradyrhizobium sp.]